MTATIDYTVPARPLAESLAGLKLAFARAQEPDQPVDTSFIPPWMIPTILEFPQLSMELLDNLRAQNFSGSDFRQFERVDPHQLAHMMFHSVRDMDPNDQARIRETLNNVMLGIGLAGALVWWIALAAGIILLKLGPIGAVIGIIAIIIGFVILAIAAAILVIMAAVRAIIGVAANSLESYVEASRRVAAG